MADVSGAAEGGQSGRSDADERAGLGLLSRFLGAVFLVLLGGLLLLDRALLRANRNQAVLDSQSAALLAESWVAANAVLLERVAGVASHSDAPADSASLRSALASLSRRPGVERVWIADAQGGFRADLRTRRADDGVALPASSAGGDQPSISTGRAARGGTWIAMVRHVPRLSPTSVNDTSAFATAGLLLNATELRRLLERTRPDSRLSLAVVARGDTVVAIDRRPGSEALSASVTTLVRLPSGGTWEVVATHALTSRSLRWSLWALGVLGIAFLAFGLLREQQRAIQVAERSIELERLYSDVKRANQSKSEFLANVSHELRTPLNAIVGFVELLRDGFYGDLSPRQVPPVDRIAASATHLRHLVDQVLDIAKIAAGRLEVHPETIVLRPFVLNIASELESLVSEKGLAFSIGVGASLPRVRTDPVHLRQILINLIGNAVKYTPAGTLSVRARLLGAPPGATPRITPPRASSAGLEAAAAAALLARAPRSGTWVALQVVDTGVGIAAADLERIFDEFEQVNAGPRGDSMQRGTGLGLAISRRLARLIGGEISVESELGRGSTFTIFLPINAADLTRERVESDVAPADDAG